MKRCLSLTLILFLTTSSFAQCDPAFTFTTNLAEVTLKASDTDPDLEHIWNFADLTFPASGSTVTHTFALPGDYGITHVVRSQSKGCIDSVTVYVQVQFPVTCDAEFSAVRDPNNTGKYVLSPKTFPGTSTQTTWILDGQDIGSLNYLDTWLPEGSHELCLEVQFFDCKAKSCQTIVVPRSCDQAASFTSTPSASNPKKISFQPLPASPSMEFKWFFGDGATSNSESPTHEYTQPGIYEVRLHINDNDLNCFDTVSQFVNLPALPSDLCTVTLSHFQDPANPARISFTAASNQNIVKQTWSITNGNSSYSFITNEVNPTHNFPDTGYYYVSLEVSTATGCVGYDWTDVRILSTKILNDNAVVTPNPVYGSQIRIQLELEHADPLKISVYNSSGHLAYSSQKVFPQGLNQLMIPVEKLKPGLYYIHVQGGITRKKSMFIKM